MNRIKYIILVAVVVLANASLLAQQRVPLRLGNSLPIQRNDELIVLNRGQVEKKLGKAVGQKYVHVANAEHQTQIVQHDDLDKDGQWDEVSFLASFLPSQKKTYWLSLASAPSQAKAEVKAHVRLRKKGAGDQFGELIDMDTMPLRHPPTDFKQQPLPFYLTEGPAWENDKVAFRLYMDLRNGRDVFGKRTSRMVMDSVGVTVEPNYHELRDWGMDVLHCGKSLGAGALAIATKNKDGKDTLIRLGGKDITQTVFKRISDGPVRAIFEMRYQWKVNEQPVSIVERIAIWGGQFFYEDRVEVKGLASGAKLVTGIANFFNNSVGEKQVNNIAVLSSYGKQSENKDELGMALMLKQNAFAGFYDARVASSDIADSYLAAQSLQNQPLVWRFHACWKLSSSWFTTAAGFERYLKDQAAQFGSPIAVR